MVSAPARAEALVGEDLNASRISCERVRLATRRCADYLNEVDQHTSTVEAGLQERSLEREGSLLG